MGQAGYLVTHLEGYMGTGVGGGGRMPALNGSLLCLAGDGATAPHQRTAAHTWAPQTSDTPPQTETRFMFGKYGVNGGRIFFKKKED